MKGLYIHIPFCIQKCKYCDFVSFTGYDEWIQEKYIDMLCAEMREYYGDKINTVFIGGGTPTVLNIRLMDKLFAAITSIFSLSNDCEISIEANPKTITDEKARCMTACGVNRVSIGAQSFHDEELKALGRIHTSKDVYNTIDILNKHDFRNVNLDLMSAIPKQTLESFKKTLQEAVACDIQHISCYSLIIEEGTVFHKMAMDGLLEIPDEATDRAMYAYACDFLKKHGFDQYEISNFAQPGYMCRHNLKYWECEEYIGVGIAAHSYMDDLRFYNTKSLDEYLQGNFHVDAKEKLTRNDKMTEFMIMGLRLLRGVSEQEFLHRFKIAITEIYAAPLKKFLSSGHLLHRDGYYYLSADAINVSNQILCEFIL